jgi:sulfite exporter TauE/SafE
MPSPLARRDVTAWHLAALAFGTAAATLALGLAAGLLSATEERRLWVLGLLFLGLQCLAGGETERSFRRLVRLLEALHQEALGKLRARDAKEWARATRQD